MLKTKSMNLNQNYIYAMFSRSYDQSTLNKGVHLIGSAYCQDTELDLTYLELFLNNENSKSILTNSDQFIIVRITLDLALDLESNLNSSISDNKTLMKTISSRIKFFVKVVLMILIIY
jgi:hypothetical protein